jgi:SAM-dependent methyltransferase
VDDQAFGQLLTAIEQDERLLAEANFTARSNALEFLTLAESQRPSQRLTILKNRLESVTLALVERLRTDIQNQRFTPATFRAELERLTDYVRWNQAETRNTLDGLDSLLNRLLSLDDAHYVEQSSMQGERVYYRPTPARIILLLTDWAELKADDVVYDLGSGTGRVSILLNLITGLKTKGIEYDPTLYAQACQCLARLQLPHVTFLNTDAQTADYSDGTVFYLYTPFQGLILQTVLDRLQQEARQRPIRIYAHGGCIATIEEQTWLRNTTVAVLEKFRLATFSSR